jgi:hypothetical protein
MIISFDFIYVFVSNLYNILFIYDDQIYLMMHLILIFAFHSFYFIIISQIYHQYIINL